MVIYFSILDFLYVKTYSWFILTSFLWLTTKYIDQRLLNARNTMQMKCCIFAYFWRENVFWRHKHKVYLNKYMYYIIYISSELYDKDLTLKKFPCIFNTCWNLENTSVGEISDCKIKEHLFTWTWKFLLCILLKSYLNEMH